MGSGSGGNKLVFNMDTLKQDANKRFVPPMDTTAVIVVKLNI